MSETPAAAPAPATYPGKGLGIASIIVAFFASVVGLILALVAKSQSKKAGVKNTPATVGLVLSIIFTVIWLIIIIANIALFAAIVGNCPEVSPGQYVCA